MLSQLRHNLSIETDARGRPLPPVAALRGRRSFSRCTVPVSPIERPRAPEAPEEDTDVGEQVKAPSSGRREVSLFWGSGRGTQTSARSKDPVAPTIRRERPGLRKAKTQHSWGITFLGVGALSSNGRWKNSTNHGASAWRSVHCRKGSSSELRRAPDARVRYNKAVDTDAQGRPAAARLWPILGRRSLLRYTAE